MGPTSTLALGPTSPGSRGKVLLLNEVHKQARQIAAQQRRLVEQESRLAQQSRQIMEQSRAMTALANRLAHVESVLDASDQASRITTNQQARGGLAQGTWSR